MVTTMAEDSVTVNVGVLSNALAVAIQQAASDSNSGPGQSQAQSPSSGAQFSANPESQLASSQVWASDSSLEARLVQLLCKSCSCKSLN